jgi:hypothetical protein
MAAPHVPGGLRKCPFCWNGLCKKHPLQDHGVSLQFIDKQSKTDILKKVYEDRIGSALLKKKQERMMEDMEDSKELNALRVSDWGCVCGARVVSFCMCTARPTLCGSCGHAAALASPLAPRAVSAPPFPVVCSMYCCVRMVAGLVGWCACRRSC